MTTTDERDAEQPTGPADPTGPRVTRDEIRDLSRLRRSTQDRMVAGVAGGIARHLDVDPVVVRVALAVLAIFGGGGLVIYGAGWLLVPEDDSDDAPIGLDEKTRGIAILVVGVVAALMTLTSVSKAFWVPWPLIAVGIVGYLLLGKRKGSCAPASTATAVDPGTGYPVAPAPTVPAPDAPARRSGPILFGWTLLLVVLAEGALVVGAVTLGLTLTPSVYPVTALAVIAAMLTLGAFRGRAGGLIALGVLALALTVATTAAERLDLADYADGAVSVHETPADAGQVDLDHSFTVGELELDLSRIEDPEALAGETLRIDAGAGDVEVVVPQDVDVRVTASADAGDLTVFGEESSGTDVRQDGTLDRPDTEDELTVDISLFVGDVTVREAA